MASIFSTLLQNLRITAPPEPSTEKAASQAFGMGMLPGLSTSLRDDVLGQPHDSNYDLLYAIYDINTDVSGSIDRWIGVTTGNDWQIVHKDELAVIDDKLQAEIDRITAWLKNPNPEKRIKFDRLISETIIDLGVTGDAYWEVIRDAKGLPIELSNIHPSTMKVVADKHGVVLGYVQRVNGQDVATFKPEQIIHFRLPSRKSGCYGHSPLERALEEITQDIKAMKANKSLMDNGFAPAAMLLLNPETDNEEGAKKLSQMIKQGHQGSGKWHKLMVLLGVKDIKPWGNTLKDMQFTELRELTTSKVATAFGVPKMYLNQKDAADYATSDVLERDLYNNKGKMLQRLLNELITEDLIQSFNQDLIFKLNPPQFSDTDALRKDAIELHKADREAISTNELRQMFSLPRLDDEEIDDDQTDQDNIADETSSDDGEETPPNESDENAKQDKPTDTTKRVTKATDSPDQVATDREAELDDLAGTLVPAVAQYFGNQERDYLDRLDEELTSQKLNGYLSANAATYDTQLHMLLFGLLVASLTSGSTAAQLQIEISLGFDKTNPFVQDYLQNHALEHAKGINTTTREAIKAQLSEGLKAGEGLDDLAKRVSSVFTDAKGYRSTLIARSETAQAYQFANHEALLAAGAEYRRWITAGESRVCPVCSPLNGYTIRFDAQYPDGLEPSRAHISCRCTEVGVTKEDYESFNNRG